MFTLGDGDENFVLTRWMYTAKAVTSGEDRGGVGFAGFAVCPNMEG